MKWNEIKIATTHEAVEAVSYLLMQLDIGGVVIEDPQDEVYNASYEGDWDYIGDTFIPEEERAVIKAYVSDMKASGGVFRFLEEGMKNIGDSGLDVGDFSITITQVDDVDWANEWKRYYKPFKVGQRLVVVPSWETWEPGDGEVLLRLDPSGAFGSGTHETTFTCLEAIGKYLEPDDLVFDIGCGSGILSVAAALLGASQVTGVDFSAVACRTAKENVVANHVEKTVRIIEGNLADDIEGKADLVVANIIADVIIGLSEDVGEYMKDDGLFIASGIIESKHEEVVRALHAHAFEIVETYHKGEWFTLVSRKADPHE